MNFVKTTCAFCSKKFFRTVRQSNEAKKFGWKQFCSPSCLAKSRITGKIVYCKNPGCNKKAYRQLKDIKKVRRSFCSNSCAATFNNHKRISKLPPNTCANIVCRKPIPRGRKYCSSDHRINPKKISDTIWRERLIAKIRTFHKQEGRIPLKREMNGIYKSARNFFGTWNKAVEAAGLHPNPVLFAERQLADDGHPCSSIAEKLIDNWLAEHGIPHKRNVFYPDKKHTADFLVNGTFIEFFGLIGELKEYDAHIQIKEGLTRKHHIPLLRIYPKDMYPLTKLNDILNNALSVLQK